MQNFKIRWHFTEGATRSIAVIWCVCIQWSINVTKNFLVKQNQCNDLHSCFSFINIVHGLRDKVWVSDWHIKSYSLHTCLQYDHPQTLISSHYYTLQSHFTLHYSMTTHRHLSAHTTTHCSHTSRYVTVWPPTDTHQFTLLHIAVTLHVTLQYTTLK